MPHLPFVAIAALVVAVPTWLLAWTELSREHRVRVHGIGLRTTSFRPMSAGFGSRSSERPAVRVGLSGAPGAGRTGDCRVRGHARRDPASACGRLGRRSCGVDAGSRRLERWRRRRRDARRGGKPAPAGAEQPTSVARGDGLAHRIIVGAGGSGGAGGAIGGPIGTGGGNGGDLNGQDGLRRPRVGEPSDRREGRNPGSGRRPGSERFRSLGHRDGRLPRSRWQRRRRCTPAAAVAEEAGSTAAAEAAPAAPSAAATAAAARASAPRGRSSEPVSAPASGARRSATTPTLAVRRLSRPESRCAPGAGPAGCGCASCSGPRRGPGSRTSRRGARARPVGTRSTSTPRRSRPCPADRRGSRRPGESRPATSSRA